MKEMIHNLLDFAGSRLGKAMSIFPERCRIDTICNRALNEVVAAHPERDVEFHAEGDLYGEFDPARIGQLLSNLLNNAVSHGDATQPVWMKAVGTLDTLVVEVGNRGRPIEAAMLKDLLNGVASSKSEMKSGSSGLGLGLYIAREIAQAHSGSIDAYSGSDKTVFTLTLPRRVGKD